MSGLILKGNTISTTGEFLPAPYIEKFILRDDGYKVDVAVFVPEAGQNIVVAENVANTDAILAANLGQLHYYVIVFSDWDTVPPYSDPVQNIIEGQNLSLAVNMSEFLEATMSLFGGDPDAEYVEIYEIFPLDAIPATYYDEAGQEFGKFNTGPQGALLANNSEFWLDRSAVSVMAFASTMSYEDMYEMYTIHTDENEPLADLQISDIAYETIWEDGTIADRYQTEYMDAEGAVYDQIPLQALNSSYYKINTMTHADIVAYFQELADEFTAEYDLDNYPKLQTMLNNMALVLETYGEKAELVPQLNALRQATPDKAPTAPIGKLYKRFRERIYTTNKAIKDSEKLKRTVLFNAKIVDLRTPSAGTPLTSYVDLPQENFIYTDWAANMSTLYDWSGRDEEWSRAVVGGTFLFDYEKALRRNSNISRVLDVDKLEEKGIHVPYDSFRITEASVKRGWYTGAPGSRTWINDANIVSYLNTDVDYPISYAWDTSPGNLSKYAPILVEDPETAVGSWPSSVGCTDYAGLSTHLVARNFYDGAAHQILDPKYRLVGFELLDFFGDHALDPYNEIVSSPDPVSADIYIATITIQDTTANIVGGIVEDIESYLSALQDYYDLCVQECAMNEETGLFNTFFSEGMLAQYEDDMENAPWLTAPTAYVYYSDLLTESYEGDSDKMSLAAAELMNQISPVNGTLEAIENLLEFFKMLTNVVLDTVAIDYALGQPDGITVNTYQVDLAIPADEGRITLFDNECVDYTWMEPVITETTPEELLAIYKGYVQDYIDEATAVELLYIEGMYIDPMLGYALHDRGKTSLPFIGADGTDGWEDDAYADGARELYQAAEYYARDWDKLSYMGEYLELAVDLTQELLLFLQSSVTDAMAIAERYEYTSHVSQYQSLYDDLEEIYQSARNTGELKGPDASSSGARNSASETVAAWSNDDWQDWYNSGFGDILGKDGTASNAEGLIDYYKALMNDAVELNVDMKIKEISLTSTT